MVMLIEGDEGRRGRVIIVGRKLLIAHAPFVGKIPPGDVGYLEPDGRGDGGRGRIQGLGGGRCEGVGNDGTPCDDSAEHLCTR